VGEKWLEYIIKKLKEGGNTKTKSEREWGDGEREEKSKGSGMVVAAKRL